MNPARSLLAASALALAVGVAATWPLAASLGHLAPASVFTGGHVAALSVGTGVPPWSTHTDLAGWPLGVDFRPLLWPALGLARMVGALAAYDLTVLTTPLLNVLGGALLGRVLFGAGHPAVALGLLLAFPPWVRTTLQNGQPEQALLGYGAAAMAAAVWAATGPRGRLLVVAPAVALAGVSAPHVVLGTLVLVGVWALAGARREPRRLAALALAGVGALAVSAYHAPGFDRSVPHFFAPFGLLEAANGPAPKRAVLASDLFLPARMPPGRGPGVLHLGYLGAPLALAGLWSAWRVAPRGERWPLVAALLGLALAFGDTGPFGWLGALSSTLAASGTPYRFMIAVLLALAILVARSRWAPVVAALSLAEAVWVDPRPLPFPTVEWPVDAGVDLGSGDGPVLDLPLASRSCREPAAHYLAEAGRHGRPSPLLLRSAELAWGADAASASALAQAFSSPDCAEALAPLVAGFGAVVVHPHVGCKVRGSERACLARVLGPPERAGDVEYWVLDD